MNYRIILLYIFKCIHIYIYIYIYKWDYKLILNNMKSSNWVYYSHSSHKNFLLLSLFNFLPFLTYFFIQGLRFESCFLNSQIQSLKASSHFPSQSWFKKKKKKNILPEFLNSMLVSLITLYKWISIILWRGDPSFAEWCTEVDLFPGMPFSIFFLPPLLYNFRTKALS